MKHMDHTNHQLFVKINCIYHMVFDAIRDPKETHTFQEIMKKYYKTYF